VEEPDRPAAAPCRLEPRHPKSSENRPRNQSEIRVGGSGLNPGTTDPTQPTSELACNTDPGQSGPADQLYVSDNTVRKQLVTLYRKLGVNTREEALTRLAQLGLTTLSQEPHE